jgi:signal transduction histidine kinase
MRSLRRRVMIGAVLWTIGLLTVVTIVFTFSARARQSALIIHSHTAISCLVAVASMVAGLALVRNVIAPFDRIRSRLADVRKGTERHLRGDYPSEVQPVVDDLNSLLDHRDETVRRALAKAGDLAHGLKTPLAVLAQEAERARADGHVELADTIAQQVERMRRQMDYHFAHARAAASGATVGARCSVLESAEGLARTLRRLHADRGVAIDVRVASADSVRAGREDLDEMLGNLLDNACKWARSRVAIESCRKDSTITIVVDDDGRGLDPSMRETVLQRGVRADEAAPGSGFGLAIVRDLAELYGGSIALDDSPLGGLRASLRLGASSEIREVV